MERLERLPRLPDLRQQQALTLTSWARIKVLIACLARKHCIKMHRDVKFQRNPDLFNTGLSEHMKAFAEVLARTLREKPACQ